MNRLVNYRQRDRQAVDLLGRRRPVRTGDGRRGERHDRNAKIALIAAIGAVVVAAVFFVLDAKLGGEPAVAVAPAGAGVAATGGWTWRF